MFGIRCLNQDSLQRIQNIANGFRNYPAFSAYNIRSYVYDFSVGVHALEVSKNGQIVNLWLFYPNESGNGKIGSIAVYGSNLQGHYNAMRSSMSAFGMRISDISFESGIETFLDVYLDY